MNRQFRIRDRAQRGFTILEIVIVFVLIAGIMAYIGPKIFEQSEKAKVQEAKIRMQDLAGRLEIYKLEVGRYPDNLQAMVKQPPGVDKWSGPYAKDTDLKDAWGNDYRYTFPGQAPGKAFDLLSLGADGKDGGEGPNRDLTN